MRRLHFILMSMLGIGTELLGQTPIPASLERALSEVGSVRVALHCSSECRTTLPAATVLTLGGVGPQALYSFEHDYALDGERFRFVERRFDPNRRHQGDTTEVAFDGCDLRTSSGQGSTTITAQRDLLHQDMATALFFPEYFHALRIEVGSQTNRVGRQPASAVLREIYGGARVDRVAESTEYRVQCEEKRGITRTTWVDAARNGAVTRSELRLHGKRLRTTTNSDYVQIGAVYFPRRIEIRRFGWAARPESLRDEPLLIRTIVTDHITADVSADALRYSALRPGSVVIDNRYSGYGNNRENHLAYWVRIPMAAICGAFDRVSPPFHTFGLWSFGALNLALLALWWLACRTWPLGQRRTR